MCNKVEVCHDVWDRLSLFRDENLDWRKCLLILYCDINFKGWTVEDHVKSHGKRLLFMRLCLQRKHVKEISPEYRYLKSISIEITASTDAKRECGTC